MPAQPSPTGDDAALVDAAVAGNASAIEQLLERHLPGLRAYVRLRAGAGLRARESSSDIVQSVCRDVLENMGRFRYPGEAAFRAWLYATAMRKIADRAEYWRAAMRDPAREVRLSPGSATRPSGTDDARLAEVYRASFFSPSQAAMGREALVRLESAFEKLPEDYREMMDRTARAMGRRPPLIIRVPVLTPRLSSWWVMLVTPVDNGLVRPLVDGLREEMVVRNPPPAGINDAPMDFDAAVRAALAER